MDISKLPILIADPALTANQNIEEHKSLMMNISYGILGLIKKQFYDFHEISKDADTVGAYLFYIFNNPGKGDFKIIYDVQSNKNNFNVGAYNLTYLTHAKLIEERPVKKYRDNVGQWVSKGFYITKLGIAVLKQNGLIE